MKALLNFSGVTLKRGGRLLFEGLDLKLGPGEVQGFAGPQPKAQSFEKQPASAVAGHVLEPQVRLHATASSRACMSSSDRPKW